jgi:arginase
MGGITLIALPYDSGRFDERMGRGPLHLLRDGLEERLRTVETDLEVLEVRLPESFHAEAQALVTLQNLAVKEIGESLARNRRILILSGNCGPAALSAASALDPARTGVIWFDAHADFNTPETSASGFLDGMALSILTGRCGPRLAARFIGFEPVPDRNVLLVGTRDLDVPEAAALADSEIVRIPGKKMELLDGAIADLSQRVEYFYVHLDVDVLDESEGRANSYATGGGLSADALYAALHLLQRSGRISVASITSYDSACDLAGRISVIAENAAEILAGPFRRERP